jgi:hypothetical protein
LSSTIATVPVNSSTNPNVRRVALALGFAIFIVPLLIAGFFVAVDPYYLFGMPSWRGFNLVRPYYEPHVLTAKPYQIWRRRPQAVVLGASSPEVGIDPHHPGWKTADVFNFSLPASNSYAIMLAFLHAQKLGARHAAVSLDFFSFNVNFPLGAPFNEWRFLHSASADFARYLDETLPGRPTSKISPVASATAPWNEALYLAVNQDVAAAVAQKLFKNGREHWELAGQAERREGAAVPADWDEAGYLQTNSDVAFGVEKGTFVSGHHHYLVAGRFQGRLGGFQPSNWNEIGYLAANPEVRNRLALGHYRTGFLHYAAIGRRLGLLGGLPPATAMERLRQRFPGLDKTIFNVGEVAYMVFSPTAMHDAISTIFRQSEPADFDGAGMRVWHGRSEFMRKVGGNGIPFYRRLSSRTWRPWLVSPKGIYCFTNPDTGFTTFDPFRFMLRRAYAEGTDLRLFVTPNPAAVRQLLIALGLRERYEFWLKELVGINEEEAARAGRQPMPLWDFSHPNTITREPIPVPGDLTPMRWYWEFSHYRKETGDLILDRIFDYHDPARTLPEDFGIRLTSANIDAHLVRGRAKLAEWAAENPELDAQIIAAAGSPNSQSRQAEATCW